MKKVLTLVLLAAMSISMLAGCAANPKENGTEGGEEGKPLTKIVISEMRSISWLSAYVADINGYFKDEGLEAEFVVYKDGPIAFQGMHAGDSDFSMLSAEPVLRAYDEGLESYLICTNTKNRSYAFAAKADIVRVEDLKGKTVFAGMPGSAPYSFVLSMLKGAGLGENDVNFINMEYGAAITSMAQGQVDGIFFDIYNSTDLKTQVPDANILLDTTVPETHKELYGTELCETTIVTCTKKFADENPETVQGFVNASTKAMKWINEHTSQEIAELILPMFEGMTLEDLSDKLGHLKTSFSATGEIHKEGYQTVEDFCLEQGLIKNKIGFENIVAPQFAAKALGTN